MANQQNQIVDELAKLAQLKESGVLTEEEFKEAKAFVLQRERASQLKEDTTPQFSLQLEEPTSQKKTSNSYEKASKPKINAALLRNLKATIQFLLSVKRTCTEKCLILLSITSLLVLILLSIFIFHVMRKPTYEYAIAFYSDDIVLGVDNWLRLRGEAGWKVVSARRASRAERGRSLITPVRDIREPLRDRNQPSLAESAQDHRQMHRYGYEFIFMREK